jgi:HTH-type transcriptional regulator/antitoxin HigA
MAIKINKLVPATAIHPGEILRDELESRNMKQKDFSELTGILPSQLNEILSGKRGINADHAIIIGAALKMDAKIWLNLQNNYELDAAKIREKTNARVKAIEEWQLIQPYIGEAFLKKLGYLAGDPVDDISSVKKIYNVNDSREMAFSNKKFTISHLRKSGKAAVDDLNLMTWIRLVNFESSRLEAGVFDKKEMPKVIGELKDIFWKNRNTIDKTKTTLLAFGIKLIIIEHPQKCAVDGLAFWNDKNPVIGLTLRFNRIDYFAFTLFHELGHVYLHVVNSKKDEFLDLDIENFHAGKYQEEEEANTFSKDNLINPERWAEYISSNTRMQELSMIKLARKEKVPPAIIKGRLSHELNNYKIKTRIDFEIH